MNRRQFIVASTIIPTGVAAMPKSSTIAFSSPNVIAPPIGGYSHIAVVPKDYELIVLAGQIGNAPDGAIPPDAETQYENTLNNIAKLLHSQKCTPADIVKINTYLVRPLDGEKIRGVRQRILGDVKPPSTMVYVPRLATLELLIEIEVWAARRV